MHEIHPQSVFECWPGQGGMEKRVSQCPHSDSPVLGLRPPSPSPIDHRLAYYYSLASMPGRTHENWELIKSPAESACRYEYSTCRFVAWAEDSGGTHPLPSRHACLTETCPAPSILCGQPSEPPLARLPPGAVPGAGF
jgi:hypothetical protein